jgi:hypothetical protein
VVHGVRHLITIRHLVSDTNQTPNPFLYREAA